MARFFKRNWMWMIMTATVVVAGPLLARSSGEVARQRTLDTLTEIMELVQKQTPEPPAPRQLTHATIQGMLHTLDPHSNYMDESEFRLLREEQKGSFFGIGAIIQQHDQGIAIISPMKGGPAERMGIRSGDIIKEIDGASTEGMTSNAALQKLRGEKGTLVEVAVQRAGIADLLRFSIPRAEVPTNSVYYSFMLNPTTGFILIKDFGETTSEEFERAVASLKKQGMKQLILDLRNNGGGVLDAAIGICRQLLGPDQLIVSQKGRDGREENQTRTSKGAQLDPFPLTILINRGSASASEIVTGAVQDHDRGLVVGQTSWGKGLVQSLLTINRSRGLALTTARYYTPSGRSIQRDYSHGLDDYYNPEDEKDAKPQGPAFKTDLNRTVYGGGGINPDYPVTVPKLNEFMISLRFQHSAFFRFAVHEKEHFGIKPGQHADDVVMARFRAWALDQKLTISDKDWEANHDIMQEQISIEMQNVAYGIEAGFKIQCEKDPVILRALELMPEAETLLHKKQLLSRGAPATVGTTL
ncbi:S41 family peptidase [Geothrix sp. PMB-07]|uniref:S41 family peptidase n=1 Tax=Geothrix sp. PMB-07 TaxID=3068640 RepID=UPI002741893B|nr:S41 family peptidase [Geothrix sp. PMB-07]WLT31853.1 S41 family peptidase [Geothrix sp. PMB-07]